MNTRNLLKSKCDDSASTRGQGPVVRSMVSANHWLSSININRLSWYLTLVSADQASSKSAQVVRTASEFQTRSQGLSSSLFPGNEVAKASSFTFGLGFKWLSGL